MTVHISRGNMKLGHIPSVSLPPVVTCAQGVPCANSACYAHKAWRQYPNVRRAWGENLAEYTMNPKGYFCRIIEWIWKHKPERFRWHVAGDIPNQEYLDYMKLLARLHRTTRFLCYTKRYDYDYSNLPNNLSIVISAWPGYAIVRVGNLPIAWCQDGTEDRIPSTAWECPMSCVKCDVCWRLGELGIDVWFHKH